MTENQDGVGADEESPLERALAMLEEVDLFLRAAGPRGSTPQSRADLLADVDTSMRAPSEGAIERSDLADIEETLEAVDSLLEEHDSETNLTDTVRGALGRLAGTSSTEDAARAAVEFYEHVVDIHRTRLLVQDSERVEAVLFTILIQPDGLDQLPLEKCEAALEQANENADRIASALETYRTLDTEYDRTRERLESLGFEGASLEAYLDPNRLEQLDRFGELLVAVLSGITNIAEGRDAFDHQRLSEARDSFEAANEELSRGHRLYREGLETEPDPFEVGLDREVPEERRPMLARAFESGIDATDRFLEATDAARDGDDERARQLFEDATEEFLSL